MKQDLDVLQSISRRALAQVVAMIHRANNRDEDPGDPKVGGHPAACASSMEILAALHLVVRDPDDFVCCKPHASPVDHTLHHLLGVFRDADGRWFDDDAAEGVMDRLRAFSVDGEPVFQSYHAESDPDSFHFLPSGSVGIPPVVSVYLALAYRYASAHGWAELEQPHFWSLIGDSEFREGSLMEVLPEAAERELGNVTWIVDYNRQSLDGSRTTNVRGLAGTDAHRIERTCEANGWRAIQLMHGRRRLAAFEEPHGDSLKRALEHGLSDFHYQTLAWKKDAGLIRKALIELEPDCRKLVESFEDERMVEIFFDLGGHDLQLLIDALEDSKSDPRKPCIVIAHTLKGNHLQCVAATGNHSTLPDEQEVRDLLEKQGLSLDRPFERFDPKSKEGKFLAARGSFLRDGIEAQDELARANRAKVAAALEAADGLPQSLDINLKLVPMAHTQWMWGQLAAKLVRIGVRDELLAAGRDAGRELTEDEQRWNAIADLVLTLAPDVGTSTNINPAMDEKVFGPTTEKDWEKELDARERLRPMLAPTDQAWSRHIRFDIAEANAMSATGAFGKLGHFVGVPFLPMMTVYDFFIKRALDQLYYNVYWRAGFVLVGTPSGVTLAPEGAQHSWKSDIQMPNLVTWEPSFAVELDWILCDAIRRHVGGDNVGRTGVLVRAVTRAIDQKMLLAHLRRQVRFKAELPEGAELTAQPKDGGLFEGEVPAVGDDTILEALRDDVLAGGYRLVDYRGYRGYRPGENVVTIVVMGALVPEALDACRQLLERGIYADVVVASSPELLAGLLARKDDYRQLREGLGIDGTLHLAPQRDADAPIDTLDVVDLAGRRVPIVSVHDGEEGLLDNLGSIVGVRQIALAVRKFSKSGTPAQVYRYHGLDADSIREACGRALAETALERVRLTQGAAQFVRAQDGAVTPQWKELWPDPV